MPFALRQSLLLLITATIWGTGFVAQALGMQHLSPFAFTWARCLAGACFLLLVIALLDCRSGTRPQPPRPWHNRTLWLGGLICGTVLFVSESLQQFGLLSTEVGKAGFLTSLYIVIVPVLGWFVGRRCGAMLWIPVLIALCGLYLLCIQGAGFAMQRGDLLVLASAVSFSVHILVIDRFAPLVDCIRLSAVQFLTASALGSIFMVLYEPPTLQALRQAFWLIMYAGVLSNGVAYTLQIVGQKGLNPTVASLIMSLEAVVSVLAGWLFMNQVLTARELLGCAVMGLAIVLAQLPPRWIQRLFWWRRRH